MTGASDYDGNIALDMGPNDKPLNRINDDELASLKTNKLMPLFRNDKEASEEDVVEILDYSLAMLNSGRTMSYIVRELAQLGMEVCPEPRAHEMAKILAEYVQKRNNGEATDSLTAPAENDGGEEGGSKRVVSLKTKKEANALAMSGALGSNKKSNLPKGNALTMSGALGSSRSGEKKTPNDRNSNKKNSREQSSRDCDNNNRSNRDRDDRGGRGVGGRGRDDRGRRGVGGRGRDDRGGRGVGGRGRDDRRDSSRGGRGAGGRIDSNDRGGRGGGNRREAEAFDRLSRRDDGRRGGHNSKNGHHDDEWNDRDGGRGGRNAGRGAGSPGGRREGGRVSGNRRDRDVMEREEDFMRAPAGRDRGNRGGGRFVGRGQGDGGRGPNKRTRMNEGVAGKVGHHGYQEDNNNQGYYDDSYDYSGGYKDGYGYGGGYSAYHGGGFRGRGRGRFGGRSTPGRIGEGFLEGRGEGTGNAAGDKEVTGEAAVAAQNHPSPMVQANFGYSASYGGRGFRGRGRGRGRFGGGQFPSYTDVKAKLSSMSWVKPKDSDGSGGGDAKGGGDTGGAES